MSERSNLVVGITGASGTIFGVRLLELLQQSDVATHLVMSRWGARTLLHETQYTVEQVQALATHSYPVGDQGAAISSGSFVTMGMVIALSALVAIAMLRVPKLPSQDFQR